MAPSINLKKRYPIALRSIGRQLLPWIAILTLLFLFAGAVNTEGLLPSFNLHLAREVDIELGFFAVLTVVVLLVKGTVAALERYRTRYRVEDNHFILTKGILRQEKGIFPISRITDVYVTQNLLDYLCFVHTVVICTPSNRSESFAQVTGLSGTDALGLCSFLLTLVQKPNDSAQEEEIIELRLSA